MKKSNFFSLLILTFLLTVTIHAQECGPTINDIFDFPIGSQFQYKTTSGGEHASEDITIETYTISNRWENGDTIFYQREGTFEKTRYLHGFEPILDSRESGTINDTMLIINEPQKPLNYCEDQLVLVDQEMGYYSYVKVENSEKILGGENNIYEYDQYNNLVEIDFDDSYNYYYVNIVKEGVGLQKMSKGNTMSFIKTKCEGYIVNEDTTGVFKNLSTSISSVYELNEFIIYPNILQADGKINFEARDMLKSVNIVSLDGRVLEVKQLYKNYLILEGIPKGMYFLTFIFEDYSITRKVYKY